MPLIVGMDEAGYGPNLGPLVVTAVAWEVPGDPNKTDLWREFDGIVSQGACSDGARLQIADSKLVYSPARGLTALETGVLAALALLRSETDRQFLPESLNHLRRLISSQPSRGDDQPEPWHLDADVLLPHTDCCRKSLTKLKAAWHRCCAARGIRLRGVRADVVGPLRFNAETRRHDSKGRALSEISMNVLAALIRDMNATEERALIIADKHGGRNRYHEFLPLVFGECFIRCREEGLERSRYQVGAAEIRFETNSERYLPVALASMVSKYVRELAMVLFNRFWTTKLPSLKPTAGYPNDSLRFRTEIAALQRELGIADDVLWRER